MSKSYDFKEKIDHESIRTNAVYSDGQFIWTDDIIIGGIYTIDKFTFDVKCVIDPAQMFKYGKFIVISIFQWKNYIIVVPDALDKSWILYDKINDTVHYKRICTFKWRSSGLYFAGENMYLTPVKADDPIVVISSEKLSFVHLVKDWWKKGVADDNHPLEIWNLAGVTSENTLYFYIYNTKYIVEVNKKNAVLHFIEHIPYGIVSISYSDGEIWVLPKKGNYIYVLNEKSLELHTIHLTSAKQEISAGYFSRIIAAERYVFMLPRSDSKIYVYDKQEECIKIIGIEDKKIKNLFPILCGETYWESCFETNKVYFMPLMNQLIIIDMETLMWESKEIYLPSSIRNFGLMYWFSWNKCFVKDAIGGEIDEKSLKIYCQITEKDVRSYERLSINNGKKIWEGINYG